MLKSAEIFILLCKVYKDEELLKIKTIVSAIKISNKSTALPGSFCTTMFLPAAFPIFFQGINQCWGPLYSVYHDTPKTST